MASLVEATLPSTSSRTVSTITKASLVEYFTVDIFEDGVYFNGGNEEDCDFTDDQGVEAEKASKV